ncbi:phosphoethanolamine--lipid A transferase EptA [Paenimyroides tangerinum]|uniref:Phosphoethanolamine--lipid A transferase EptA n=1 Tax=Paenimyroides tangerinum TaxID=2488728 RepID=A0A3P3W3L2_9FLAO|nr:phosphoethanolamine--lipid A transferase EptA [Paenimyroides tangerinum]RRJ89334.1 phosphoethanolamine--lipid A transferase EptA [Paenimyroides tangerinum]
MLKNSFKLSKFVLLICIMNFLFFHYPFFKYVFSNVDYTTFSGALLCFSMLILVVLANFFFFYILFYISKIVGKIFTIITFLINSVAVYFINSYSVIIDESMISNILNTNFDESSAFFSFKLIIYLVCFGILPSIFIFKAKFEKVSFKKFMIQTGINLGLILLIVVANAANVLWIDKNSKVVGGLAMPWSYAVNTPLFYIHEAKKNQKEILLPDATITNDEKSVMVLVIGESARSENFSLYGYSKNTNPLLSKIENLHNFNATSCATYTTAGLKCILEHENSNDLYEILPNYLNRNDVDVIWRTTNWGEPPVHIEKYKKRENLIENCEGIGCDYDEILLAGLKDEILNSNKKKILIILHTSTSHGPTYSKKYPPQFEVFKPVCNSVEVANCSQEELINAYDNTIVYTDFILSSVIETLKELPNYKSSMIYVSDHGESLGEKNLYMHGVPMSLAPKQQYEIPFIVWVSDGSKELKKNNALTQNHVFHSVMNFLGITSPIYNEEMNIYK